MKDLIRVVCVALLCMLAVMATVQTASATDCHGRAAIVVDNHRAAVVLREVAPVLAEPVYLVPSQAIAAPAYETRAVIERVVDYERPQAVVQRERVVYPRSVERVVQRVESAGAEKVVERKVSARQGFLGLRGRARSTTTTVR